MNIIKKGLETLLVHTVAIITTPIYFVIQVVMQFALAIKAIVMNTVTWPVDVVWNYNVMQWWKTATEEEKEKYLAQFGMTMDMLDELKRDK